MMRFLIYFTILTLISCNKEEFNNISIKEASANYPPELKRLSQLRLALSKTVANATGTKEFCEYLVKESRKGTTEFFNEILLEVHKGDIIKDKVNLIDFLKMYMPDDVKELFGDSLFSILHKEDPCVVIKIPDIFYNYDWDINKIRPMVYAGIPSRFIDGGYRMYHYSGYEEEFGNSNIAKHFYITIKLSEDYSLYNTNTWNNEKGISLFEILPQAEKSQCWSQIKDELITNGILYESNSNMIYIHKYEAYLIWQKYCGYKDPLLANNPCGEKYLRDCANPGESGLIIEAFEANNSVAFNSFGGILRDGWNFFIATLDYNDSTTSIFCIPDLKYNIMGDREVSLTEDYRVEDYDHIGKVCMPYMKINFVKTNKHKKLAVNGILLEVYPFTREYNYVDVLYYIGLYEDLIIQQHQPIENPFTFNCSVFLPAGQDGIEYRDNAPFYLNSGDYQVHFTY